MTTSTAKKTVEQKALDPETEQDITNRKCMMCQSEFSSAWSGERICRKCKSSSKWRDA